MKYLIILTGSLMVLLGACLAVWLGIYVMLYGGIMAAINNIDTNTGLVVWGIIRAMLFELGLIPGYVIIGIGVTIVKIGFVYE